MKNNSLTKIYKNSPHESKYACVVEDRFLQENTTRLSGITLCSFREELLLLREEADKKISELQGKCQELQSVIQQVSEDFQKVSPEYKLHQLLSTTSYYLSFKMILSFIHSSIC